ncbi:hypothetical protein LMH87_001861 [Akanthomyces muscarius]|uniref:Uncharacterized protein n=2 Tax=Akanthomyces muscarius TaxID=2231603 RepID=A0A9W8Q559_AKAMU|nr:hypothetical protein LMH87_001861 [Akanthomyces muscarius]KAJ4147330.1 hypothetical protein LMH87_001861 [Akanthomyces muscarius]
MTRQHSNAFLPSGGFDRDDLLGASPSRSQAEPSIPYDLQPIYEYHTHSTGAAAAPRFAAPSAPHFNYTSSHMPLASSSSSSLNPSFRRDSSLSPTDIGIARAPRPSMLPPPAGSLGRDALSPSLAVATSLSRSASADAAAPQQTSLHLVQRLAQQNSLIREAWEAERKYLEANRKRAEEVYQEERTIMEDMRESWLNEKAAMHREVHALRDRVQHLESENAGLRSVTSPGSQWSGLVSPSAGAKLHAHSLPPGLEGAARRPHFLSSNGSRASPTGNPEQLASMPLDPRTQPETSSARDFLAFRKKTSDVPIPLIDVHEIDPKLDGIFIKANAVRDTFTQSSVKSSPATSPPTDQSSSEQAGVGLTRRSSSKAQTMQALAAGEMRRRTMHAGHTPNHSLSLFPTMTTLDGSMTAGQSEATTPTALNKPVEQDDEEPPTQPVPEPEHVDVAPEEDKLPDALIDDVDETQLEPRLEPKDDVPLKGPLMVKNIPAQDEIFWARVNQKLEGISHSKEEALPTVIKSQLADDDDKPKTNGSASDELDAATKPVEADVPLKMRTTTNFGAPFGVA